jgi:hypothetical protein
MSKYLRNRKKSVRKRIKLWNDDEWDIPSGNTRKGERYYRKIIWKETRQSK